MKFNKVIVAVSLEDETHKVLSQIKELEFLADAQIQLVHAFPVIFFARGMNLSVVTYPLMEERPELEKDALARLAKVKEEFLPNHQNVSYKCFFDMNEKAAFCDYVAKEKCDLVIVATRGKHGLKTIFDSSFAQYLLKYSHANLLVLK